MTIKSTLLPIVAFVLLTLTAQQTYAQRPTDNPKQTVCFCHNINNNPTTICTDNQGLINGHQGHVDAGNDTLGACPEVPAIPEFGIITGVAALVTSAGSYFIFKRGR